MRKILGLFLLTFFLSRSLHSVESVHILKGPIKYPLVIAAEREEWRCSEHSNVCISGYNVAALPPLSFHFTVVHRLVNHMTPDAVFMFFKGYLIDYGLMSNELINNLTLREHDKVKGTYKIDGNFLDGACFGSFELYIIDAGFFFYVMFIKIKGELNDVDSRDFLYNKAISLIRPVVS